MSSTEKRAVISIKNYNKIVKLAGLPFDVSFDKACTIVFDQLEKEIGHKN